MSAEKGKLAGNLERLNREILEIETAKAQIEVRIGDIKAELSSYSNVEGIKEANADSLERELISKRTELESIGAVNLKAPELYDKKRKDVEEVQQQMSVLETEKTSVLEMIKEIESKKLNIFSETLDRVDKNFKKLFNHIFEGEAELGLDNPKDPFNSGLNISMTIDRRQRHIDRLSGGEKLLVMLMLIFSIQMMRPMSFYIFDEIDASLDKENSKKLSLLIKELGKSSQFVVVTHNDSMLTASDTNIGVAMHNHESRAVGIMLMNKP
jgi:chromosome segregation protein